MQARAIIEKLPELSLVNPTANKVLLDTARSYARKTFVTYRSEKCPIWGIKAVSKNIFGFVEHSRVPFIAQIQAPYHDA